MKQRDLPLDFNPDLPAEWRSALAIPSPEPLTRKWVDYAVERGHNLKAHQCSYCGCLAMGLWVNDDVCEGKFCENCFDIRRAMPKHLVKGRKRA